MFTEFKNNDVVIQARETDVLAGSDASASVRQAFFDWLTVGNAKKYSPTVSIDCIDKISEYAINKKISRTDLWRIKQRSVFKSIYTQVMNAKLLRVMDRNTYSTFAVVGQLYFKFLKEKPWAKAVDVTAVLVQSDVNTTDMIHHPVADGDINVLAQSVINPDDVITWLVTQPNAYGRLYLEGVARTYMSALRNAPKKLELDRSVNRDVFRCQTVCELDRLWGAFKLAPNFVEVNRTPWHGQFSAGLAVYKRYLEHLETDDVRKDASMQKSNLQTINNKDINIIESAAPVSAAEDVSEVENNRTIEEQRALHAFKAEFPVSMNLGFVDLKKLKTKYKSMYNCNITLSDEQVYSLIRNKAIQIDSNRYTHIDNLVSADALRQIKDFLDEEFSHASVHRFYTKPLFDKYKAEFSFAVNEEILLTIIESTFGSEYKANRKSMFIARRNSTASPNINTEICNAIVKLLAKEIQPFDADEIALQLQSYPKWRIESVLNSHPEELVAVSDGKYAHTDYVYIEQDDIEKVETIITSRIETDGAMNEDDLYAKIAEDIPDILEMNPEISEPDILKVIKNRLSGTFNIKYDWQSGTRFLPKEGV